MGDVLLAVVLTLTARAAIDVALAARRRRVPGAVRAYDVRPGDLLEWDRECGARRVARVHVVIVPEPWTAEDYRRATGRTWFGPHINEGVWLNGEAKVNRR